MSASARFEPSMGGAAEGEDVPVVSVVMPVYNASPYLAEAIGSILAQTFTSLELIIVDDGSTDHSKIIAEGYVAADPRVRLIAHQHNQGNYPSRNEGMALARGEFLAVMDADDIALPQRLERQVDFLRRQPEYTMVGSQVLLIDPDGAPLGPKGGLPAEHEDIDAALMDCKWAVVHPTVMMRKVAFDAVGGYRECFRTCADQDVYLRLAEIGRIANLPETLLCYRQRYESLTRIQTDQWHHLRIIQREARERRNLPPLEHIEVPPTREAEPLSRHQKMQLRFRWAEIAMQHGYMQSALKNLRISFSLDPAGVLAVTLKRARRSLRKRIRANAFRAW